MEGVRGFLALTPGWSNASKARNINNHKEENKAANGAETAVGHDDQGVLQILDHALWSRSDPLPEDDEWDDVSSGTDTLSPAKSVRREFNPVTPDEEEGLLPHSKLW